MDVQLEEAGFVPDTSEVLQEMEEEWKEGALRHHSEKLRDRNCEESKSVQKLS